MTSISLANSLTIHGVFTWLSAIFLTFNKSEVTMMATGILMVSLMSLLWILGEIGTRI